MNPAIPIVLSGIASMVVGSLWYGPFFSKPWMKLNGIDKKKMPKDANKMMAKMYVSAFVLNLIMATAVYLLTKWTAASATCPMIAACPALKGAHIGLLAWLGFVATSMGTSYLFLQKPFKLYLIDAGYYLVTIVIAGLLVGAMA